MYRIHAALTRLNQDEKGTAAVEYGLTGALLAVVLILAASVLGGSLSAALGGVASAFSPGAFNTGLSSSGQAAPSAGTTVCQQPQAFLQASPGTSCQNNLSNPAAAAGYPATAG